MRIQLPSEKGQPYRAGEFLQVPEHRNARPPTPDSVRAQPFCERPLWVSKADLPQQGRALLGPPRTCARRMDSARDAVAIGAPYLEARCLRRLVTGPAARALARCIAAKRDFAQRLAATLASLAPLIQPA